MTSHASYGIRAGTCGFREAQDTTFSDFPILEVQKTFYQPPQISTAERWREKAPDDFVFTLKAWQMITHESSSPTYRRMSRDLTDEEKDQVGSFRWNETTAEGWERTRAIADALEARAIVFQTPKSFEPTIENLSRMDTFFSEIDGGDRYLVFEPRGEAWTTDVLEPLLKEIDLVHGVDPFIQDPVPTDLQYLRLHGKPAYNYRYEYTDEDLEELRSQLRGKIPSWVLFNNYSMADDARRFLAMIG